MFSTPNLGRVPQYGEITRDQLNRALAELELVGRWYAHSPLRLLRDASGYAIWLDQYGLFSFDQTITGDMVFQGDTTFEGPVTYVDTSVLFQNTNITHTDVDQVQVYDVHYSIGGSTFNFYWSQFYFEGDTFTFVDAVLNITAATVINLYGCGGLVVGEGGKVVVEQGGSIRLPPPDEFFEIVTGEWFELIVAEDGTLHPVAPEDTYLTFETIDPDVTDVTNYFITITPPGGGPPVKVPVGELPTGGAGPGWTLVRTLTDADFTAAATTQDISVYDLPAKVGVIAAFLHVRTVTTGGAFVNLNWLFEGALTTTGTGDGMQSNNIGCAFNSQMSDIQFRTVIKWAATTNFGIRITTDINVDNLSGGAFDIYFLLTATAGG